MTGSKYSTEVKQTESGYIINSANQPHFPSPKKLKTINHDSDEFKLYKPSILEEEKKKRRILIPKQDAAETSSVNSLDIRPKKIGLYKAISEKKFKTEKKNHNRTIDNPLSSKKLLFEDDGLLPKDQEFHHSPHKSLR